MLPSHLVTLLTCHSAKQFTSIIILLIIFSFPAISQVAINNDGSQPTSHTILDVKSDTEGMLIPRMTTVQRNSLAASLDGDHKGMLVFDKTGGYLFVWTGTSFEAVNTGRMNEIADADNDTYVDVEWVADADEIVMATSGNVYWTLKNGRMEITNTGSSVFIGGRAGENDDLTSNCNVFIGQNAGKDNTSGTSNVAIGFNSLSKNNAWGNTSVGYNSLSLTTTGISNTGLGYYSLYSNTTGQYNTAIGSDAKFHNETGNKNIGLGHNADYYNVDGDENTMIGYEAGRGSSAHSKHRNIFLGYQAGYNEAGNDKLYIENSNSPTPLIGGDFSTDQVDINGTIKITGGNPAEGKILKSDATGTASWVTIAEAGGVTELNELSDAISDGSSVFIGEGSGENDDANNNKNVAVGISTLAANTSGQRNHAIGHHALGSNTTGSDNFAVGIGALQTNTTGNNNIALGNEAMETLEDGSKNIAIGIASMYNGTVSSGNTMLGYQTGYNNTSGDNNIFIGYQAGYNETGSNKLYIDNSNTVSPLIYGDFDSNILGFSGNVGVNTKNPLAELQVHNNATDSTTIMVTPQNTTSGGISRILLTEDHDGTYGMLWRYNGIGSTNRMELWGKSSNNYYGPHMTIDRNDGDITISGDMDLEGDIEMSGDMVIGTTSATGYKLSVGGKVICEELRVNLQADWPDYVFTDNYNLMPVNDLESFIEDNGHLPNVSPAAEMEKSGLEVGENQRMMMEKIEELTLYIIQLKNEIEELKTNQDNRK